MHVRRRLAAVLAADVVGYSRLMGEDERGTYERLKALRRGVVEPAIAEHDGRIVKLMGDGLLAEFASAVNAVDCALAIQRGVAADNADVPDDRRILLRIGVNVGDILVEGRDIHGDGVNVAARLEALAEPGGVCISEDVHRHVHTKIAATFQDLGERQLKNIAAPVRAYQLAAEASRPLVTGSSGGLLTAAPGSPKPPDKPSIVVLPFDNMSNDAEQTYFSDGIAEDLITDLSKVSGLFVIARNSAFTYKGRALDLKQVCRDLGVRYALEGSVRKAGTRVRITAQLIDGATGGHLWAERYDRELTDVFAVQDEVTREIVDALKVKLSPDESRRVESRGTSSLEAYDRFLRGRKLVQHHGRESTRQAQALFEEAIAIDGGFALAHAYLALGHAVQFINRWSAEPEASLERARQLVEKALALDPAEAQAHFVQGVVHLWEKRVDEAIGDAGRAIALDPNLAEGYVLLGNALHYAGRSEEAVPALERAVRLDPHHPAMYLHFMAQNQLALGLYEEAAATLGRRLARQPDSDISYVLLAACYGHLGRADDARTAWAEALRINPDYSLAHRRGIVPYKNPADFERVVDGLRAAGIAA